MRSTIYEVDEDVYQITTEHEDGRVTVETVFGRDAYDAHFNKEMKADGQRAEHTGLAGYFAEYTSARRVAGESTRSIVRH